MARSKKAEQMHKELVSKIAANDVATTLVPPFEGTSVPSVESKRKKADKKVDKSIVKAVKKTEKKKHKEMKKQLKRNLKMTKKDDGGVSKPWKILMGYLPGLKSKKKAQKLLDLLHRSDNAGKKVKPLTLKEKENMVVLFNSALNPSIGVQPLAYDVVAPGDAAQVKFNLNECLYVTLTDRAMIADIRDAYESQGRKW